MAASIEILHPGDDPALAAALVTLQRAAYAGRRHAGLWGTRYARGAVIAPCG